MKLYKLLTALCFKKKKKVKRKRGNVGMKHLQGFRIFNL